MLINHDDHMQLSNRELGALGEQAATDYLIRQGYVILSRNWRGKRVELDIVALDGNTLVFCEVKTRRSNVRGLPAEAVTAAKFENIRSAALMWIGAHKPRCSGLRFDVVSVMWTRGEVTSLSHLKGIEP